MPFCAIAGNADCPKLDAERIFGLPKVIPPSILFAKKISDRPKDVSTHTAEIPFSDITAWGSCESVFLPLTFIGFVKPFDSAYALCMLKQVTKQRVSKTRIDFSTNLWKPTGIRWFD